MRFCLLHVIIMKSMSGNVCKMPDVVSGAQIRCFLTINSHTPCFLVVDSYIGWWFSTKSCPTLVTPWLIARQAPLFM